MSDKTGNGWKRRSLWRAFADGFEGIGEAKGERIMRIIWVCVGISAAIGVARPLKELGWIFLTAYTGMLIALEHINNVIGRQENWRNRVMVHLRLQDGEWNEDTRYILHQATAAVLVLGITGLVAGTMVLVYNPGFQVPAPIAAFHDLLLFLLHLLA